MITVEECIVQSLYYRLVLITVRRGKQNVTTANGSTSGAAAGSSADDAVEESSGDGVDTTATFHDGNLIVGEVQDDDTVTTAFGTDLDKATAKYALAQGLGFLSLGSQLQRNPLSWSTNNNGMEMIQSSMSSNALSRSLNIPGDAKICVTRNVRTILEAGETRLEQAFLSGSGASSTSTELQPLWRFGSSLDKPELNETSSEETTVSEHSIMSSSQPLIDLRSCDQFSIVRMEDLRDPTAQSIMMVQTNETPSDPLGGIAGAASAGMLHSELVDNRGTLYVEGAGGLVKRETYALQDASTKKHLTAIDQKGSAKESVHEMDSGIWDMMHALESGNDRQLFSSAGNSLAHVDLFQTTRHADEDGTEYEGEESGHSLHRSPSDELQGTYKVYQISDAVDGAVGAESVKDNVDSAVSRTSCSTHPKRRGVSKKERDRGGLSDVLQPITVVNFAIHRVEVPMVRLEVVENSQGTISSYCKKVLDESVGTQTSIDLDDKSIVHKNVESNGREASSETTNNFNDEELDETLRLDGQSATDARIRKLCAEIQNLTAKEQSTIGEFCMKSQKSSRCTSPFSPDAQIAVEGQFEEDDGDGVESPRAREAYRDIVEITSVRSSGSINRNRRKSGGRHGESDGASGWPRGGSVRMTKSERSSPRTSRLMNADEFSRCEKSPHSADGSPTRQYFTINSPEMDLLPLRSSSPCVRRISTTGKIQHHSSSGAAVVRSRRGTLHSSTSSIGNADNDGRSVATIDSSLGNLCDESAELIDFERFTDWMGELPDALHNVPLSSISIPGSHICVAIEKDMRVDMDFSKCNYEMAEFLRKLPNLAIFNAFRTQMKAVWKAWMPKQCLGVHHQLEAGARYLDVRVTKYLSAFYGEHGLYTRQLKKYLKEIRLFIEEHPTEVVILHFELSDHLDRADKRRLVTMLFQVFGAKMACNSSTVLPCPTLRWMWDNRKQLIVYFPDNDMDVVKNHIFGGLVWSDDFLDTVAPKKQSVTELVACLDDLFTAPRADVALPSSGRIHVTKAVLSPDMSMVFSKFDYKSMHELARAETADAVSVWLAGLRRSLNVVAVDFIGVGDVARNIVRLNYPDRRVETLI